MKIIFCGILFYKYSIIYMDYILYYDILRIWYYYNLNLFFKYIFIYYVSKDKLVCKNFFLFDSKMNDICFNCGI